MESSTMQFRPAQKILEQGHFSEHFKKNKKYLLLTTTLFRACARINKRNLHSKHYISRDSGLS